MPKVYLGDGVYVALEAGQFILTTENGVEVLNTIYLEPEIAKAFFDYAKKAGLKV